ncbi:MAG TPA: PD-(D/E)XK nuclease family protein, partial [Nitrospiria bacterium]|nr:PD-(D/E)XK nuclease family protein [Nitrospiria bacterium]
FKDEEVSPIIPAHIEKGFKFFVDQTKVTGRWDRIDEEAGKAKVIDYKSSNVTTQKKADEQTGKSLQLSIYALAYREQHGAVPDSVELHFLDTGLIGRAKKTDKDLEKTLTQIREVADGIRAGDFTAMPSYMACQYCAYNQICPYTGFGKGKAGGGASET